MYLAIFIDKDCSIAETEHTRVRVCRHRHTHIYMIV